MLSYAGTLPASKFIRASALSGKPLIACASTFFVVLGMSDDEADSDLLELLRKSLGVDGSSPPGPAKTGVLEDAEYIYDNSTDVAVDMRGTKMAASSIWTLIQQRQYSARDWSKHELHPKAKDESTVDFIFLMDLLNFSFWSDGASSEQYAVEYRGKSWTGYWSLVAAIQRALDEGTIWSVCSAGRRLTGGGLQGYRSRVPLSGSMKRNAPMICSGMYSERRPIPCRSLFWTTGSTAYEKPATC